MIEDFWKDKYPAGIAAEINPDEYPNVQTVLKQSCQRFASKPAFSNLGKTLTYGELYELSGAFAAYLQQHTDLQPGDRIALQLPNLLQYPIAVFGAIRAGLIVVNTNPLYTAREMEHQFNDSGAKALVCLANMAHLAEAVVPKTGVRHVIVTEVADMLPPLKRLLINSVIKYVKKMVPAYHLPKAVRFNDVLSKGLGQPVQEANPASGDVAVLQYTGGTTGVAKGAMLTHRNLVANMLQCRALMGSELKEGCEIVITPLPLYHIYAFTFHCMAVMLLGNHNILISNPRDLPAMVKELSKWKFSAFVGLNTLFVSLCNNEAFRKLDFSALKVTLSGGMALQLAASERWKAVTGCSICEGYGMTETSPVASVNPSQNIQQGTIGVPVPSTLCKVINDEGVELPLGEVGELCIKGPQRDHPAGRLHADCRPQEGHDSGIGLQRLSERTGGRTGDVAGCAAMRGVGRTDQDFHRRQTGCDPDQGAGDGAHAGQCHGLQGASVRRVPRCAADHQRWQDPAKTA